MSQPLKIGILGAGGYAQRLIEAFTDSILPERAVLAAVSTSRPEAAKKNPNIQKQGSQIVNGADALFNYAGLDAVIIPTSIDSHLRYTTTALNAGLHVLCEKPAAGSLQDVDAMINARDQAGKIVAIGFQDTYSTSVRWAKDKILNGEIGKVIKVRCKGKWPRTDKYFSRNSWAGTIKNGDDWVLDSPAHNAMAHQINMIFFLLGSAMDNSDIPVSVRAELYRARPIENYDTCFMKSVTANGADIHVQLTHACAKDFNPDIEFIGTEGSITRVHPGTCELKKNGKIIDSIENNGDDALASMFDSFLSAIEGNIDHVGCTIENARSVTLLINGASQCAKVVEVPESDQEIIDAKYFDGSEDKSRIIQDIDRIIDQGFESGQLPSEMPNVPWSKPAGEMDLTGYNKFTGMA